MNQTYRCNRCERIKTWTRPTVTPKICPWCVKAKGMKLTPLQYDLLLALSFTKWKKPPLGTKAATILSLQERGLLKMRMPRLGTMRLMWERYADYELLRLPAKEK